MESKCKRKLIKFGNREEDVDEGIADLILDCWKMDLTTFDSCQELLPNVVWIEFDLYDGEKFINLIAKEYNEDKNSLYSRVSNIWKYEKKDKLDDESKNLYEGSSSENTEAFGKDNCWRYDIHPVDMAYHFRQNHEDEFEDIDLDIPEVDIKLILSIAFPKSDLKVVKSLIRDARKEYEKFQVEEKGNNLKYLN